MMDEKDQNAFDHLQKDEDVDHNDKYDGECYLDEKRQTISDHLLKDENIAYDEKNDGECYFDEKHQMTSEQVEDIGNGDNYDGTCYSDEEHQTNSDCLQDFEVEDNDNYFLDDKLRDCFLTDERHKFTLLNKLGTVAGIVFFIIDFALDIVVCYQYYRNGNKNYFGVTVATIVSSSLLHTLWSLVWYLKFEKGFVSARRWIFRVIFLVFPLSPVLRLFEAFWYGIKFQRSNKEDENYYYDRFCSCFLNAAELRLGETFMEAAPQLLIQAFIQIRIIPRNALYPAGQAYKDFIVRLVSIFSSLVSLTWSLVSYYNSLFMEYRLCFQTKIKVVIFLWQFFSIASRVMALVLFASFSLKCFGIYCGLRIAFVILMNLGKGGRIFRCNCDTEDFLLSAIKGIISTFCYFNYKSAPIKRDCILYYTITAIENTVFSMLWYSHSDVAFLLRIPLMCFLFLSFSIGITIMMFILNKEEIMGSHIKRRVLRNDIRKMIYSRCPKMLTEKEYIRKRESISNYYSESIDLIFVLRLLTDVQRCKIHHAQTTFEETN